MTVKELLDILNYELIDGDLILYDYEDNVIQTVNLIIGKDGSVEEARLALGKP